MCLTRSSLTYQPPNQFCWIMLKAAPECHGRLLLLSLVMSVNPCSSLCSWGCSSGGLATSGVLSRMPAELHVGSSASSSDSSSQKHTHHQPAEHPFVGLWRCSCSYSHRGTDTGPTDGLKQVCWSVQLSFCSSWPPDISSMILRLCWERQQSLLWPHRCFIQSDWAAGTTSCYQLW